MWCFLTDVLNVKDNFSQMIFVGSSVIILRPMELILCRKVCWFCNMLVRKKLIFWVFELCSGLFSIYIFIQYLQQDFYFLEQKSLQPVIFVYKTGYNISSFFVMPSESSECSDPEVDLLLKSTTNTLIVELFVRNWLMKAKWFTHHCCWLIF